jgi:predicted small lipoprotein YifL
MLPSIQECSVTRVIDRRFARLAMIGALAAALGLAGCGRKGPLDPPPGASLVEQGQAAPATGPAVTSGPPGLAESLNPPLTPAKRSTEAFGPGGEPIAPKGQKKPVFLDWLID